LPDALHAAIGRLAEITNGPLGGIRLIELEAHLREGALFDSRQPGARPCFPHWDILRSFGGEIAEVSAFAAHEQLEPGEPVLLAGRFEGEALFQVTLLPSTGEPMWRLRMEGRSGQAELVFPQGWLAPARMCWSASGEQGHEENWPAWSP